MTRNLIFAVVLLLAAVGSYAIGFNSGKGKMDLFCGTAINGTGAVIRGEAMEVIAKAINEIRSSKQVAGERELVRYAKTQARIVSDCRSDPNCLAIGKPLPDTATIAGVLSLE